MKHPQTLTAAIAYFSDADRAFEYAKHLRWPDGKVTCPRCAHESHSFISTRKLWFCKGCKQQFTLKVGTIFEDSAIGLDKWMTAVWMIVNCRNGMSSWELHRVLGVTQKSAWFMLHRIREALKQGSLMKIGGGGSEVEVDETFVGGKTRFMHKSRLAEKRAAQKLAVIPSENPYVGKTPVQGIFDRESRTVRASVIANMKRETLQNAILDQVEPGAKLMSDESFAYGDLAKVYVHQAVNHAKEYVKGRVHTNGLENFWSLLKRGLKGTYVAVEPFHLDRYVDEQVFRFNHRGTKQHKTTDFERFAIAMSCITGKRLTYEELTGKSSSPRTQWPTSPVQGQEEPF
jgi:transposase-like protein